ncbi:hypothetical protein OG893_09440 [Streptomyces sp. NBC_01696]|uniref:hypothetical protein n=1 Tax=unclassified Streptomyces TaxID=2593676 RepID=UPI0029AA68AC|nr:MULTISPECIES: hypothetical protein [unclassified Streptomyces]MDX3686097.1 hypothetical protein [Streptomyces sp. AK04-4c]
MRSFVHVALFLLVVLEMAAGLLAGSVALASLITEAAARTVSAGAQGLARRAGVEPISLRLREELAAVLATTATTTSGGTR